MPDISKIQLESGIYNIKDETARKKLKQTYKLYDNLDLLKNDEDLENNSIVATKGYYSANDGGQAYYLITNEDTTIDGYFIIGLQNNFKAILLYDTIINIKCLGAKCQDKQNNKTDIAPFIKAYLNELKNKDNRITLFIPSGVWYTSPILIDNEYGFSIIGEESWQNYGCGGTTISSLNNNQEYIFKIGNGLNYVNNFVIKNITFSSCDFLYYSAENNYRSPDNNTKRLTTALFLHYAGFGVFENIYFNHIIGECLAIQSSWELRFNKLNFSFCSNIAGGLLTFKTLDTSLSANANISNIEIQQLNFESVNGDLIKCEINCGLIDSVINNFHFEPSSCLLENCTIHELNDGSFNINTVKHLSLINLNGNAGLIVNNILLNNIAYRYILCNNIQYFYDCILNLTNTTKQVVSVIVNNIIIQGMNRTLKLAYQETENNSVGKNSKLCFNNINNYSAHNCIFDVKAFPTIENKAILRNTRNQPISLFNNSFNAFSDFVRNSDNETLRRFLYYDSDVLNNNLLCVKPICTSSTIFCNTSISGTKLKIRAKIENGKTYKLTINNSSYSARKAISMVGTGSYKTYELDLSDIISSYVNNPSIIMYSHSDNTEEIDVSLDYFYFE